MALGRAFAADGAAVIERVTADEMAALAALVELAAIAALVELAEASTADLAEFADPSPDDLAELVAAIGAYGPDPAGSGVPDGIDPTEWARADAVRRPARSAARPARRRRRVTVG